MLLAALDGSDSRLVLTYCLFGVSLKREKTANDVKLNIPNPGDQDCVPTEILTAPVRAF